MYELQNVERGLSLEHQQLLMEQESDTSAWAMREDKRIEGLQSRPLSDPLAQRIATAVFEELVEYFEEFKAKRNTSKYARIIQELDSEKLAGVSLAMAFNCIFNPREESKRFQNIASTIGRGIVTELKIDQARQVNPIYMMKVHKDLERRFARDVDFLRGVYDFTFDKITAGKLQYNLTRSDYMQIGKTGLDALREVGLIVDRRVFQGRSQIVMYELDPEVHDYITNHNPELHKKVISTVKRYMICPPDPWEGMFGGGFKSPTRKSNRPLISRHDLRKSHIEHYNQNLSPEVLEVANYVQSIPFKINPDVINLAHKVFEQGGGMFSVPQVVPPPKPEFPFDEEWDKDTAPPGEIEVFMHWKRMTAAWHLDNTKRRNSIITLRTFFEAVNDNIWTLYFPIFYDYRGRIYYHANPSPQGDDLSRAALVFERGKPLGKEGLYWLKVHLANSLGEDKARFDLRVQYVDSILDKLFIAVEDPVSHLEAFGDEAPMSAYVAALELKRAYESGSPEEYVCHVPVHMDATVSGTQHYSALLRDPVGARYTNLQDVGEDFKADMYTRVASLAYKAIQDEYDSLEGSKKEIAYKWLKLGIPRDIAKRPVMTYTYGVTKHAARRYVLEYFNGGGDVEIDGEILQFSLDEASYVVDKIFDAIADTIPATVGGMEYLQEVVRKVSGKPLVWKTPVGFPVYFDPRDHKTRRVAIRSAGVSFVRVKEFTDDIKKRAQISGIAPHFIHSLDSAHLSMVVLRGKELGLDLVCIHDSIGTHPSDVGELHKVIREEFVTLYEGNPLEDFISQIGGSEELELPEFGDFDIRNVLESEFFFC